MVAVYTAIGAAPPCGRELRQARRGRLPWRKSPRFFNPRIGCSLRGDFAFLTNGRIPEMFSFRQIEIADALYRGELALRDAVLRAPQGRGRSHDDLEKDRAGTHFVAIEGEKVVGCLGLYPLDDSAMEVRHVAVDQARRRMGIAAGLFRVAEDWAFQKGFRRLELDGRTSASEFYQSCGFAADSEPYRKHGIPHVKYRKALSR